jgi:translation initiation factor 1
LSSNKRVYSSEGGRTCPKCNRPVDACVCGLKRKVPPSDGTVRVSRETKGRKGKGVTLVTGVPLEAGGLADLAKQLKNRCGAGGTVKNGIIEIQGDHRDTVVAQLQQHGWTVKKAGG